MYLDDSAAELRVELRGGLRKGLGALAVELVQLQV